MPRQLIFIILLITILFSSCNNSNDTVDIMETELNTNWEFRQVGTEDWMPAQVPGSVHTDLMNNGKIEDPYYRLNERDVQWVDKEDWEYRTHFNLDGEFVKKEKLEIL